MKIALLAAELLELRTSGRSLDAVEQFFAPDVACLDVSSNMTACFGKAEALAMYLDWERERVIHDCTGRGPWVNGNRIVFELSYDVTVRDTCERRTEGETAIYTIRDGKVSQLQFFRAGQPVPALLAS